MSTPGPDSALAHFLSALDTCMSEQKRIAERSVHLSEQRTRLIKATRATIETLDPKHRPWWRQQLRALIGDEAPRPEVKFATTDRLRAVRDWLRCQAPALFHNEDLREALAEKGMETRRGHIGAILTRLSRRGEVERIGHGAYRVNYAHPAYEVVEE